MIDKLKQTTNTPPLSDVAVGASEREKLVASAALVDEMAELLEVEERVLAERAAVEVDEAMAGLVELLVELTAVSYESMYTPVKDFLKESSDIQLYIDNVSKIYGRVYRSDNLNPFTRGGLCSVFAKVVQEESGKDVEIVIEGDVEDCIGIFNQAGVVVRVSGSAGDNVGSHQKDGVIYVAGDTWDHVGYEQTGGEIHIDGNAGEGVGSYQQGGEIHISGDVKSFRTSAFDTSINKAGKIYLGDGKGKGDEVLIYDGSMKVGVFGRMKKDMDITLTKEAWEQFDVNVSVSGSQVKITPKT